MKIFLLVLLITQINISKSLVVHWDTVLLLFLYLSCIQRIRGIILLPLPFKLKIVWKIEVVIRIFYDINIFM